MKSKYDIQAEEFLTSTGTTFLATLYPAPMQTPPSWAKPGRTIADAPTWGLRYCVTLTRGLKEIKFDYWGSFAERAKLSNVNFYSQPNLARAKAYDVLTCAPKFVPDTFTDFCAEYGYCEDSRQALATFESERKLWEKFAGVFSAEELERLAEIQ